MSATPHRRPRPATRGSRRSCGGFSLNELVLIIVLLGILAVVVVPSFNAQPFLARGYVDEVAAAARHAQKLAVASGCPVRLATGGFGYTLHQSSGNCFSGSWDVAVPHPSRAGGYAETPPSGVTVGAATIVFNPDGSSGGGNFVVGPAQIDVASTGHVQVL